MLRKIVKILMGVEEDAELGPKTFFESLIEQVREPVQEALSAGGEDPVEVLARAIMATVVGDEMAGNPQAARAYFSVVAENDRLPYGEQLDEDELALLKDLLVDYFAGNESVRDRANEVLTLIERKFSQGAFTQAKILLQIFETDVETRLNNERNLFYEDMIMRLGVRRRHEVPEDERADIRRTFLEVPVDDDVSLKTSLAWLADEYYVNFCLAVPVPSERTQWEAAISQFDEEAQQRLLGYVPPLRWRSPALIDEASVLEQTRTHLSINNVTAHVQRLTKMCYFLLLASGDTGFESFVYHFLEWSRGTLEVEAKSILPVIHRRSVLDEIGLQDTLDTVFQDEYVPRLKAMLDSSDDALKKAWRGFFDVFAALDINEIPPGNYDLGGFLLDQLLGFEQPDPYFAFKLYRLT